MAAVNPLNVYKGRDSMVQYYDPNSCPPVPLVEIPDKLNPFRGDGVRIYAKMLSCLPANNVKSLPARNMLEKGVTDKTKKIVEYSSGSTVLSLALISRAIYGIDDMHAFVSNKTSEAKLRLLRFFGITITLFGGHAQPEPTDRRGGIHAAKMAGESDETTLNANQYDNHHNPEAHVRWTGPQIMAQCPEINVFAACMGTSGTVAGCAKYIKSVKPSVHVAAICTAVGDRVPGPRARDLLAPTFPWKEHIDTLWDVTSPPSYQQSMNLTRNGLICGPSSGMNLAGLLDFLAFRKAEGTLKDLAGENGDVHCVFLVCDLPYQYVNEYFDKLGEECFPPIINQQLHNVDLYRYDLSWELDPVDAIAKYYESELADSSYDSGLSDSESTGDLPPRYREKSLRLQNDAMVLDLRPVDEFEKWSLPGSINMPLATSSSDLANPFDDPKVLEDQWRELDRIFSPKGTPFSDILLSALKGRRVGLVCNHGDTARIASSVLRAKGLEASSIAGGIENLGPLFCRSKA
ncbi:tryptophan synthase beta subunit-like PLP-dependent enzyme [Pyronema domesticum]|nr:tryptophan synthase beta subunit-like PLP-dependent enzyme [Pyronema domesticum]